MTKDKVNVEALFLGPKSENEQFFKDTLDFMMEEHMGWRRDFHPEDVPVVKTEDKRLEEYQKTLDRTKDVLLGLSAKLKKTSMPWFSPRYMGQMNADTLMVANLAYMATILYNPNNVAYEASTATTPLEIEVGKQLAKLMGYNPDTAWGHITSGGSMANFESVWVSRNLKSIPLAIKAVKPEWVAGMDDWQLLNMPVAKILDLVDRAKETDVLEAVREHSVRGVGLHAECALGKILVPQSKHYCWVKASDVFGLGNNNLLHIQVDDDFHMDMQVLKETIDDLVAKKEPILAVVAVVGTTEEGAVDKVDELVQLRKEYEKQGVSFCIHVDAAYGGYTRAMFLDENSKFMEYDDLKKALQDENVIHQDIPWPSKSTYKAYKAMSEVDSISIDPHKMGYVPYAAGAVLMRDRRILDLISYFSAYLFEKNQDSPSLLGAYIMQGSKAGATAAAVWAAHEVVPLNISGYGRVIGRGIDGAHKFHKALAELEPFEIDGKKYQVESLVEPDFNIVCFSFNEVGNTSLNAMNDLNEYIFEQCSYNSGPVYLDDFLTSKTELSFDNYGDAPLSFVEKFGIQKSEWEKVHSVYVLRACVLNTNISTNISFETYWNNFLNTMKKHIERS